MKFKHLILSVTFLCCNLSNAQFSFYTGPSHRTIERLLFVYRDSDAETMENLQTVLFNAWQYEQITLIAFDEYKRLPKESGDLVFSVRTRYHTEAFESMTYENVTSVARFLDFYLEGYFFRNASDSVCVASTNLFVDDDIRIAFAKKDLSVDHSLDEAYNATGKIFNWNYAFLGTFVRAYSDYIDPLKSTVKSTAPNLKVLKNEKLYISDNINLKVSKTGSVKSVNNSERVKSTYGENCEVVSNEKLNELMLKNEGGFVLFYLRGKDTRRIIVVDLKIGTILYNFEGPRHKYDFEIDDIKLLKKAVEAS